MTPLVFREHPWAFRRTRLFCLTADILGDTQEARNHPGVGEDLGGFAGVGVAAKAPATGWPGERRQEDERFLPTREMEDDVATGQQAGVVDAGLPTSRHRVQRLDFPRLFLFIPAIKACPGRKASGQALVTVCAYGTMAFSLQ